MSRLIQYFASRFPIDNLNVRAMLEKKEVPLHSMSWGYYTGGLTLFFFIVQFLTGLLLLFYYQPTVSDASLSVEYLENFVSGGALIRNMHAWAASGMILCLMVHFVATFAMKAFAPPREFTWLTGVLLLFITFSFGFTGYLLPWNQVSVNATKVVFQSIESIGHYLPGILSSWPHVLKETFQGGSSVGQATLLRFYAVHVVLLPLMCIALLAFHLICVQLHGMSQGIDKESQRTEKFFPVFFVKDLSLWSVMFWLLFTISLTIPVESFLPFPLLAPFNALGSTPAGIKPEWYFYFVYYPLELLPFGFVLIIGLIAVVLLLATPWLFKNTSRRTLRILSAIASAYLIASTVFGEQIYHLIKGQ
jgi:cytochrome b6